MPKVLVSNAPFTLTQDQSGAIEVSLLTCEYVVGIRKNETGEVRFYPDHLKWTEGSIYWWSTGNMSCDCNRELLFLNVKNELTDDSWKNCKCGEERYTVVGIWFPNGDHIWDLYLLNDW